MAYCTLDGIEKLIPEVALIQLTDDEDTGAVVPDRITEAIAQADAEIDSYCSARYTVPFASPPPVIKKFSVDIAIYNLYSRRVENIPETRSERYKNAIRQLEGIAKGLIALGMDPEPEAATGGGPEASGKRDDRIFTMERPSDKTTGTLDNY